MPKDIVVEWHTLVYVVGALTFIILAVAGGVGWAVWWIGEQLRHSRHDAMGRVSEAIAEQTEKLIGYESRIKAIELYHAGLQVVLKQMDEFRAEIGRRFEILHKERKEDMKLLHGKLDAIKDAQ